jgi:hypothetical protein
MQSKYRRDGGLTALPATIQQQPFALPLQHVCLPGIRLKAKRMPREKQRV